MSKFASVVGLSILLITGVLNVRGQDDAEWTDEDIMNSVSEMLAHPQFRADLLGLIRAHIPAVEVDGETAAIPQQVVPQVSWADAPARGRGYERGSSRGNAPARNNFAWQGHDAFITESVRFAAGHYSATFNAYNCAQWQFPQVDSSNFLAANLTLRGEWGAESSADTTIFQVHAHRAYEPVRFTIDGDCDWSLVINRV